MTTMKPTVANLTRGDVILVLFPNSNLRTAKTRPAVVVQANHLATGLDQLVVAMITSRLDRGGHASRVVVPRRSPVGQHAGLLRDSLVMTDNLATVAEVAIDRRIGSLLMDAIDKALRHTLSL
jgi:mRNA interferase MazF